MSVYKPTKGQYWWYDFRYKGNRYSGSTGAKTRSKAERVEAKKRIAAASGELDKPEVIIPTLSEAAVTWWDTKSDKRSADQLLARVTLAVELVGAKRRVNMITFADVQNAIQRRRGMLTPSMRPPANATINRDIIATLRPVLKLARKRINGGVGVRVPFPEIDWGELTLPEPKPKPKGLSRDEVTRLVEAVPEHLHDFVRFQARYGCRISEMFFGLDDVDVEACRVTLRDRKGGGDHTIPIRADDAAMLAARISRAKAAKLDTVWFREVRDKKGRVRLVARTSRGVGKTLSEAVTTTGVRATKGARGSHSLRHTAGTDTLRQSKGNFRVVQKLLGHASFHSTLVYAHALEDDLRAVLDSLSQPAPEPAAKDDEKERDEKLKA